MSPEGGEADHLQIGVNLRAVINDFQRLSVEGRTLIAAKPLGIHVGKQAAEGTANQPVQRHFFQFCQRRIAIPENPVHCAPRFIEYHFNIRKRKGDILKAAVIAAVLLRRGRDSFRDKAANDTLLLGAPLLNYLFSLSCRVVQQFTVAQDHLTLDIVNCHHRYQTSPLHLNKAFPDDLLQLLHGNPDFIDRAAADMNFCVISCHQNIKDRADADDNLFSVNCQDQIFRILHIRCLRICFFQTVARSVPTSCCQNCTRHCPRSPYHERL